ncbi:MAG TPA: SdrD B-like domain-containing protein, partial [Acidimicrobiia bacterium]|nr:SdrD B-like domain-containing protein [Acidimicrobiia bacterium]
MVGVAFLASLLAIREAQANPDSTVNIVVKDAQTEASVDFFKWAINLDNSHDQASLENPQSYSPVVATGDQSNALGVILPDTVAPDRGYLVSVYANDGVGTLNDPDYKIGGEHFTLPADAGDVVVELQPNPLPLATIKVRVFVDNASINGEWDNITESPPPDVEDFHVVIDDRIGETTTDWFGSPICTEYEDLNGSGTFDFPGDLDLNGDPVPIPGTGGFCSPGPDGVATIPNLGPNKFAVEAIPPDGSDWVQTSTIEGTLHNDAWIQEGAQGFATEPEAGLFTQVWFGFVEPCTFGDATDSCPTNDTPGTGLIKGTLRTNKLDAAETVFLLGNPIPDAYVGLTDVNAHDAQVYMARANPDGTFEIPDVPASTYILSIWDRPLDHIIKFLRFTVPEGGTVDIGGLIGSAQGRGVPPWFGKMVGSVYLDANENGIRDPGETGIPGIDLDTRFKEGSIQYTTFTDNSGEYVFPEVFELEHFFISEVGYGRFRQTGVAVYNTDEFDNPVDYPWVNDCTDIDGNLVSSCTSGSAERECTDAADWRTCEHGPINQDFGLGSLLQATFLSAGQSYYFDWGKNPFGAGENGGIVGIVFNATTRNELDASLQANEDYEPGVPGVTVNLYATQDTTPADGAPDVDPVTGAYVKDHIAATYLSDSWYDLRPTNCVPIGSFGRDPTQIQPYPQIWDKCLELESILNQDTPGVFDGGYAFDLDCTNPADPEADDDSDGIPNRLDPDHLLDYGAGACDATPIAAGKWIVEIEPPTGIRSVMEEDINVFSGDQFVPAVPPPPCAGPMHTVDVVADPVEANFDPANPNGTQGVYNPDFLATTSVLAPNGGSPYEGFQKPLCNARLIDLKTGFNANS